MAAAIYCAKIKREKKNCLHKHISEIYLKQIVNIPLHSI